MKKIFLFITYILIIGTLIGAGPQSTEERVKAIDDEIQQLMRKKASLELLKKNILKSANVEKMRFKREETQSKTETVKKIDKKDVKSIKNEIASYEDKNKKRPKIALVLSGGGAKGAAHIGVLKVLEKNKVPIDMIVGTSIGSIVGGMYSIGYTPEEIEKIMLGMKFSNLLSNSKDRSMQDVEEKAEFEKYPFTLNIDESFRVSLPKGALKNQNIYFELKKIFERANAVKDFDNFPIKFRAITSDLQDGSEVIIDHGDLAISVLKSMSLPSIFEPVEDNGHFYVDGGVVNNFPIDTALKMQADIIIAVDITTDALKIDENSNLFTVVGQLSMYNGDRNTEFQKKLASILIVPEVKNHSTIDFSGLKGLIDEGERAALQYEDLIKKLGDPEDFEKIRSKAFKETKKLVKNVHLRGNDSLTLKKVMALRPTTDEYLSEDDLENWAKQIYSITYIDKVKYNVDGNSLYFDVKEKNNINVKASVGYSSNYGGSLNFLANIPNHKSFIRNYSISGELSNYPKISLGTFSFYDLDSFKFGSMFSLGYNLNPLYLYNGHDNVSTYRKSELMSELSFFTSIFKHSMVGVSVKGRYVNNAYSSGTRQGDYFRRSYKDYSIDPFIYIDTLNRRSYPTKGFSIYLEGLKNNDDYTGYSAAAKVYFPITEKVTMNLSGTAGKIHGDEVKKDNLFKIGGTRTSRGSVGFFGLPPMGKYSDKFYVAGAGVQYKLTESLYLLGNYNVLTYDSYDVKYQEDRKTSNKVEHGYGVGVGLSTFSGPISVFVTNDINKHNSYLFEARIGYFFDNSTR